MALRCLPLPWGLWKFHTALSWNPNLKNTMTEIQKRIEELHRVLPQGVRLVAVSKFHPIEKLQEAYAAGQRIFGESRAQELREKAPAMPHDVEWHFIGHLQQNKVKTVAPVVSMIHAVDSLRLLQEIDRQAERFAAERSAAGLPPAINVLLQLHVAREETKFGFSAEELEAFLAEGSWRQCRRARICGLMCMASNTEDMEQVRREFLMAYNAFHRIRERYFSASSVFAECSWGMSEDYPIALQCGSTLVRIGSYIFGPREY